MAPLLLRLLALALAALAQTGAAGESDAVSSSKTQDGTYQAMARAKEKQLADMILARDMPESTTQPDPSYELPLPRTRHTLTAAELNHFHAEGYVILEDFFSAEEVELVKDCMESDPLVMGSPTDPSAGRNISVPDATGRSTKLTLWWNFGDDSFGQIQERLDDGRGFGSDGRSRAFLFPHKDPAQGAPNRRRLGVYVTHTTPLPLVHAAAAAAALTGCCGGHPCRAPGFRLLVRPGAQPAG
jgi:hypothetical protein